jgi:arylsulfatase A-like enzyme
VPSLVPEIVRVPLVITGDVSSKTVTTPVNLLDINQTISDLAGISDPPRGQNVLIDPDPNPTLTEAHGISEWQRQSLRTRDISDTKLNIIDKARRGILIDDYYGYESLFDGWVDIGGEVSNPKSILDEIVLSFESQERRTEEISDDIRTQLADMGYI